MDHEIAVERLAALVHEAWVEHRRKQGWQHGEQHDHAARRSPSLVPYEQLADAERELDRVTVRRTLAGLRELGYSIELDAPLTAEAPRAQVLAQTDRMIAQGRPLLAYDLSKRWLAAHANDEELQLRNARALRRCGALVAALQMLDSMGDALDDDGERRGLRAAVHKEMFARASTNGAALEHLRHSQRLYQDVFEESGGVKYWHGINAATLAFLLGRVETARELAQRVAYACATIDDTDADYWLLATRAEAALIQGQFAAAAAAYRLAVKAAGDRIGDIASTRQNALLLLGAYGLDGADRRAIERALQPPAVVVFAGHALDRAGTLHARFPQEISDEVRAALDERLQSVNAGFGFSGAAPGAEMLFVEAMLDRAPGVISVVLPWPREQFAETHVRTTSETWQRRFGSLLGDDSHPPRVQHIVNATLGIGIDAIYERFAQQILFGLARLHARTLVTDVVPLVVWDGVRGKGTPDDIAELIDQWQAQGVRVSPENIVDVRPMLERRGRRYGAGGGAHVPAGKSEVAFRVMAILFADVENYSKIPENHLPDFIEYFVGGISSRLGLRTYRPANVRRVGDGLLMVFTNVRDAGLCALDLVDWVVGHSQPAADGDTYWSRAGLPREMRVRVALHAGPVFECIDPLTRAPTFEGAHINYAARIEPVTPANQVYASEAFAALAASWPAACEEFLCEYVGRTSLAKKFGEYPLYHVRRQA